MQETARVMVRGKGLALAAGLMAAAILTDVQAQITATREWNVSGGGTWNTASNWNPANIPDLPPENGSIFKESPLR